VVVLHYNACRKGTERETGMRDTIFETRQSWRFIHDPVVFRKKRMLFALLGALLVCLLFIVFTASRYSSESRAPSGQEMAILLFACLLYGGSYHFFAKGKSFVIDKKGIHFSWHFWPAFPRHFDWSAIEVIRLVSIPTLLPRSPKSLAFKVKGKRAGGFSGAKDVWYILPLATWVGGTYTGDGHAHSLVEILTAAQGRRIEEIHADEIDRLPLLIGQRVIRVGKNDGVSLGKRDLGRRFLLVTLMIPVIIVTGAMTAASVEESPILLKVSGFIMGDILIPGGGLLLAIMAGFYLRKEGNEVVASLLCLLLGGAGSFFLFMPVTYSLPEWLGDPTQEQFSVIHADKVCQEWQGTGAPELSFSLYAEPGKRHYPEVGTKREFTVHRGPLQLASIPGKEFGALYEKGAKISFGKCPPDAAKKIQNQREEETASK
jgi:hypothetical protein